MRTLLGLAVLALIGGSVGCQPSPRQLAERFAAALEHPADADFDGLLATDAEVFLAGPNQISTAGFRDYLVSTQRGHTYYHRASRVYVTPGGAGWMLEIVRDQAAPVNTPAQAQLWMEIAVRDGKISRAWIHFTLETLGALHQTPEMYARRAAETDLALPPAWSNGTLAMLAAAEARDRDGHLPAWPTAPSLAAGLLGIAGATVLLSRRRRATEAEVKRGARLLELSSRRRVARKRTMPT